MAKLLEDLPVDLVGANVLGYLSLKDIVMLERVCGSKKYHQAFMEQIPHRPPVELPSSKHNNGSVFQWLENVQCRLKSLTLELPGGNPCLHAKNLKVEYFDLQINSNTTIENLKPLLESNMGYKVLNIRLEGNQKCEVMEQLSVYTANVKQLTMSYSNNCSDWLTADILSRWKLKVINLDGLKVNISFLLLIVQTCTELTSIKLCSDNIDDAAVIAIAQHCPKLETLLLRSNNITWTSLLALLERGLPLKELDIDYIPSIPTADIARRCSHALSYIRHLHTFNLHQNGQDANILLPYMTGLTSVDLNYYCHSYIPLLTQHCHKLTKLDLYGNSYSLAEMLSLCRVNPLLQELRCYITNAVGITNTALIELIHVCPHLHTLRLPYETAITDIGILALSEHCPQLQELTINICYKVTEAAVLHLLQCCNKLTTLYVSSSSLSKVTWAQLDKNTQKRVSRW